MVSVPLKQGDGCVWCVRGLTLTHRSVSELLRGGGWLMILLTIVYNTHIHIISFMIYLYYEANLVWYIFFSSSSFQSMQQHHMSLHCTMCSFWARNLLLSMSWWHLGDHCSRSVFSSTWDVTFIQEHCLLGWLFKFILLLMLLRTVNLSYLCLVFTNWNFIKRMRRVFLFIYVIQNL